MFRYLAIISGILGLVSCGVAPGTGPGSIKDQGLVAGIPSPDQDPTQAVGAEIQPDFGGQPIIFEPNKGQTDSQVRFLSRTPGYNLYLSGTDLVFDIILHAFDATGEPIPAPDDPSVPSLESASITLALLGAKTDPDMIGEDPASGVSNYLIGNDPSKWVTNVPRYKKVRFSDIYPGIDVVFYGTENKVEHDFIVSPGGDPGLIKLGINDAKSISIAENGVLNILISDGRSLAMQAPITYQMVQGQKVIIDSHYELSSDNIVGFKLGAYDTSLPLIIDPVVLTLTYSTFLGGNANELVFSVAVTSLGSGCTTLGQPCVVAVGYTKSANFPKVGGLSAPNNALQGTFDAFVSKIGGTGATNIFTTYLGGTGDDLANSVRVDSSGNVYVTGYTTSSSFPTAGTLYQAAYGGGYDAFISKLNSTGSLLTYSSYIGGSGFDRGAAIVLDTTSTDCTTAGTPCVVMVGTTISTDVGLSTAGVTQPNNAGGAADAFVTRIDATGARVWFTFLGGSGRDLGTGIAIDPSTDPVTVYVSGETRSSNFPTTAGVVRTTLGGTQDAFVTKLNGAATAKQFSTYIGGNGVDSSAGIVFENLGLVAGRVGVDIVGTTTSTDLPATAGLGYQTSLGGGKDIYLMRLSSLGTSIPFCSYFGGTSDEQALGFQNMALDANGRLWVTGSTKSTAASFPIFHNITGRGTLPGSGSSAFVMRMSQTDPTIPANLSFSTYLGGTSGDDIGVAVAVDPTTQNVYAVGQAATTTFPTTAGALQTGSSTALSGLNGFISKVSSPSINVISTSTTSGGATLKTSLTVPLPGGTQVGDLVLVAMVLSANLLTLNELTSITSPVNFHELLPARLGRLLQDDLLLQVMAQRVQAGDVGPYTFTFPSSVVVAGVIVLRNVDLGAPSGSGYYDGSDVTGGTYGNTTSGGSVTTNSTTVNTYLNNMQLYFYSTSAPNVTSWSNMFPIAAGAVPRLSVSTTVAGRGAALSIFSQLRDTTNAATSSLAVPAETSTFTPGLTGAAYCTLSQGYAER